LLKEKFEDNKVVMRSRKWKKTDYASHKEPELPIFPEHISSLPIFGGVRVAFLLVIV
jgi:hypothetical protein